MSMVQASLYNPLVTTADPVAARRFLPCRMSRITIIRVRRTLSEAEIERYGTANRGGIGLGVFRTAQRWEDSTTIPIPISMGLVQSIAAGLGGLECVPKEARYMRQGRTIAQRLVE